MKIARRLSFLLFSFQLSLLLQGQLSFFLLLPLSLVSFSRITHIGRSWHEGNRYVQTTSEGLDILGARSSGSRGRRVGHVLPFSKALVAHALHAGAVEKQVLVAASADESESLVRQSLDSTFCHCKT